MTLKASSSRKELEAFARQAKTTEEDFQGLAFATSQFGINAEQIADISKDISDKLGEMTGEGSGQFMVFANIMQLTKDEAKKLALEFQSLSSQDVIGKMVSQMEKAGVSGNEMTTVLEAMGNDLSKITPLFVNNSAELNKLKGRFDDVNSSLQITAGQAEKLKGVSTSFDLLTAGLGNAATAISATIAPVVDQFFNDIIDVVPDATQTIIDFINSFLDAENITSIVAVNKEIAISSELVAERTERVANATGRNKKSAREALDLEQERLTALEKQLIVLEDQEKLADAKRNKGGSIGVGGTGADVSTGLGTGDEIQAIADRFLDEEDLLIAKLERELVAIGENDELKLQLQDEFLQNIVLMDQAAEDEKTDAISEGLAERAKLAEQAGKAEIALETSIANNAIALTKMVLGDNKAAALAGLVIQKAMALSANATATLSGSQLAFASQLVPGDPTSIARAEVARDYTLGLGALNAGLIVATGFGQAGIITGGGGGGAPTGGGGSVDRGAVNRIDDQDESQETSITVIGDGASTSIQQIEFSSDGGSAAEEFLSMSLNDGVKRGSIGVIG